MKYNKVTGEPIDAEARFWDKENKQLADESPIKEDGEDDKEICEFGEWANGLVYINEKYQNSSAIEFKNMKEALAFWREKIHRK